MTEKNKYNFVGKLVNRSNNFPLYGKYHHTLEELPTGLCISSLDKDYYKSCIVVRDVDDALAIIESLIRMINLHYPEVSKKFDIVCRLKE